MNEKYEPKSRLAVVKTEKGTYRVSCLREPFQESPSFRCAAARIHDYAIKRPELFAEEPFFYGLSEKEKSAINGMRMEILSSLEIVAAGTAGN